jgi:probable DNA repair protein
VLAGRWRRARGVRGPAGASSPRAWADAWRGWLAAVGWPGDRPLSSAEHQACGAWDELLVAFATLGAVEPRMARGEALAGLRALATGRVFQPEAPRAPIQILGVLEAAGLPFDALWIAGLAAETWPPAPRPNPLLPYAWQRERDVPRATAARELARAKALTAQLVRGAPEVVVSHASRVDDHERVASALIVDFPVVETAAAATKSTAQRMFDGRPAMERVADDRAPPVVAGTRLRGGAGLVEAQGDCPFRAVAAHRLATAPWPTPGEGLSPLERGSLVHGALAAFWVDVRDHAALSSLPPEALDARVEAAVAIATAKVEAVRWRALPPIVAAGEARRIAGLVRAWLEAGERSRPPFEVVGVEIDARLTRHDVTIGLRIDRLDRLADGGIAIIDYKTGVARVPAAWLALRPEAPQLGLYALARHDAAPGEPVRAVAYAQLKPGELKVQGIAADPDLWPALPEPAAVRAAGLADWPAVERRWEEGLGALFREIAEGVATVAPRDAPMTCRHCGLQSLCRIGTIAAGVEEGEADA